ncbi:peroxidase-related enzyme [Streptomyces antimycoticus]|uniref:Alkyl hydroperoxide reductase AhpD n=1 Tax=Streptomyces antimycoticus TaxID=68175 RepID=A0A4D4KJ35_9ACTN|nr:carboxymuconolactone decarboxylase family protein [Streptomyces antimycoticus]GDY49191.1 alkyl hydroperoxide reductase AhpD [Streptomyces antimycoticus]
MSTSATQQIVPLIDRETATGTVKEQLDQIHSVFGAVPPGFQAVANSPATLTAMWTAFGAYGQGSLGAQVSEQIAVAVANTNKCEYCLAVHTGLGRKSGLSKEELSAAQIGESTNAKTAALLGFVLSVIENRGHIDRSEIDALRELGWSNEQIVETLGQVALNVFTNYIHVALDVPNPFPAVPFKAA